MAAQGLSKRSLWSKSIGGAFVEKSFCPRGAIPSHLADPGSDHGAFVDDFARVAPGQPSASGRGTCSTSRATSRCRGWSCSRRAPSATRRRATTCSRCGWARARRCARRGGSSSGGRADTAASAAAPTRAAADTAASAAASGRAAAATAASAAASGRSTADTAASAAAPTRVAAATAASAAASTHVAADTSASAAELSEEAAARAQGGAACARAAAALAASSADRRSRAADRSSGAADPPSRAANRSSGAADRRSRAADRSGGAADRWSHAADRPSEAADRRSHAADRPPAPRWWDLPRAFSASSFRARPPCARVSASRCRSSSPPAAGRWSTSHSLRRRRRRFPPNCPSSVRPRRPIRRRRLCRLPGSPAAARRWERFGSARSMPFRTTSGSTQRATCSPISHPGAGTKLREKHVRSSRPSID